MYLPECRKSSVEPKTVQAVLDAVLQSKANTRNQIANEIDVSTMTVGKAVQILLRAHLLTECEEPTPRGRYPRRLYPSERLHSLIVYLTPKRASVRLCSADGIVLDQSSVSYCDSLPWEGNLACLRGMCDQRLSQRGKTDTGVGVGVILREDCAFSEYAMDVLLQILQPNVILWERELLIRELSREEYGGSVLYLSCGETVFPTLIMGQTCIDGCPPKENTSVLLDALAGMLSVISVACVVAEERDGYTAKKQEFLQALANRLPEEQGDRIRMTSHSHRRFAELAMERELRLRYAEALFK